MKPSFCLPVSPKFITQPFGFIGNLDYYHANGLNIKGHNGTDLLAGHGQPVYAAHDGMAYWETDIGSGHGVVVRSNTPFDYISENGAPYQAYFKTIYWHFCDPNEIPSPIPTSGMAVPVKAGDLIGWADSTGLSTGDHLHWSCKPCTVTEPPQSWYNIEQNNGYMGCIDPMQFWNSQFTEDLPVTRPFLHNITIGDHSSDVVYLQRKLRQLGFFNNAITGYYGPVTKAAVYAFQLKYVALDWFSKSQVFLNRGDGVYSLTRSALNKI